jgi:hypothetical protein
MKIALDYDRTYDKAPEFWDDFIDLATDYGHEVRIVTARNPDLDNIDDDVYVPIIYCDGVAKRFVCHHFNDWDPDIWIDDKPESVDHNSTATKEQLAEWRKNR